MDAKKKIVESQQDTSDFCGRVTKEMQSKNLSSRFQSSFRIYASKSAKNESFTLIVIREMKINRSNKNEEIPAKQTKENRIEVPSFFANPYYPLIKNRYSEMRCELFGFSVVIALFCIDGIIKIMMSHFRGEQIEKRQS